jgi:hypothetical protein
MIWNQVSTVVERAVAWAIFLGSSGWALVPVGVVGHVGTSTWVAELFGEDLSPVEWLISRVSIPSAFSSAGRLVHASAHRVVSGVLADSIELAETIGEVDEFLGSGPDTLSFIAGLSIHVVEAFWSRLVPLVGGGWVAEVVLEQLAVGDEVSVVGNSLSWSPCAVVSVVV